MTIEFNCHVCGKLLRTADEKAGRTAKCPGCGEAITVPEPGTEEETAAAEPDAPADEFEEPADEYGQDEFGDDEFDDGEESDEFGDAAPSGGGTRACPMCGESISTTAATCKYCGEEVGRESPRRRGGGRRANQQIEAGEVISTAWEIFKSEMGLCIGGVLIVGILSGVAAFGLSLIGQLLVMGMMQAGQNPGVAVAAYTINFTLGTVLPSLIQWYLQLGLCIFLLNIARGQNAEISDIFSGGPFFMRMTITSFLFTLMIVVGLILCIVPGVIVALMFWPYAYVLVDRNPPGIDCLSESKEITDGNWLAVFVLALAGIALTLLGALALCVGLLFTGPLTSLMMAVAYCQMTGQRTARV